ncbi:MAG: NADP-specific glutamate dehydrogenase [Deltaproteobacteria bacterium]|jgi:glutamate dehydrogenase (NADP+)|nr:NADP-specific glutamate dehydrogenase [Deltaproteobacteria bacterium]MBW2483295.1 NADP-specific glutamate dehydrogenase [Deltaproteobacteria bacterium]
MSDKMIKQILARDPEEKEFHQAVQEFVETVKPVLERHPEYHQLGVLERVLEPERVIMFRVPWMDDEGWVRVNRGYRVEMNSAIGPYKGGLRFHPSVNHSILKFLAFEQVFKNALTTLPMGGAQGGSDFEPKGKSDDEVMRFCQSFMTELSRHIGQDTDIPGSGLGVGAREIGFLFGMYKRQSNEFTGVLTGKGLQWGGSQMRAEATGYGVVYFAAEMLAARNDTLEGKTCLVSGAGNVAQHTAEKIIELGGKVLTLSDSSGYIYDSEGIDAKKLAFVKRLKNLKRGRIQEYVDKYSETTYIEADTSLDYNPLWNHRADCAFPCAVENEIGEKDAYNLINNGIKMVCEGADMPASPEAIKIFLDKKLLYAPGKAANAGGVAVSGLEMAQNRMLLNWSAAEVDERLRTIVKNIHQNCLAVAEEYGDPGNYLAGANIAGFVRVVDAMLDQGLV